MQVCSACAKYGEVLGKLSSPPPRLPTKKTEQEKEEVIEQVKPEFARLIRQGRERLGLNQEDFAKRLSEKESLVHKLETGTFTPPIPLAKKIERFLGIRLVEEVKPVPLAPASRKESESLTLGDAINIRQRKPK